MDYRDPRVKKIYQGAAKKAGCAESEIPVVLLGRLVGGEMSYRRLGRNESLPSNISEYSQVFAVIPVGHLGQFSIA